MATTEVIIPILISGIIVLYLIYRLTLLSKKKKYLKHIKQTIGTDIRLTVDFESFLNENHPENVNGILDNVPFKFAEKRILKFTNLNAINNNKIRDNKASIEQTLEELDNIKSNLQIDYKSKEINNITNEEWLNQLNLEVNGIEAVGNFTESDYLPEAFSLANQTKYGLTTAGDSSLLQPETEVATLNSKNMSKKNPKNKLTNSDDLDNTSLHSIKDELFDFGLDNIPIAFSLKTGLKEINSVRKGKKNVKSAFIHSGIDIAGKSGGAFAGSKAGLIVGGLALGPPGALAGAAIGGIAGSVSGKIGGTYIKEFNLNKAIKDYEKTELELNNAIQNKITEYDRLLVQITSENNSKLEMLHQSQEKAIKLEYDKYLARVDSLQKNAVIDFLELLGNLEVTLKETMMKIKSYSNPFKRGIFPGKRELAIDCVCQHLKDIYKLVSKFNLNFRNISNLREQYVEMLGFIAVHRISSPSLEKSLNDLYENIKLNEDFSESYISELENAAQHQELAFKQLIFEFFNALKQLKLEVEAQLYEKEEKIKIEMKKLGK